MGSLKNSKWVMLVSLNNGSPNGGSGTQYFIGDFDGKTFTNGNAPSDILWLDYGRDNYAGVTWANEPDNRCLFIGWMSNWRYAIHVPTHPWRSAMTIARELNLRNTEAGLQIFSTPVPALSAIRQDTLALPQMAVKEIESLKGMSATSELQIEFTIEEGTEWVGCTFSNKDNEHLTVGYELAGNAFFIDRTQAGQSDFHEDFAGKHTAPYQSEGNRIRLHIFLDVASIEVFVDNGKLVLSDNFFPTSLYDQVDLVAKGGKAEVTGKVYSLASVWR